MKKIALTSLIAMFAFAGAHAGNVIDGNPLYMPKAGHFYSVSSLETGTRNVDTVKLKEDFGFGIMDRWTIELNTELSQDDWFKMAGWDSLGLTTAFRFADYENWKWDVIGGYGVGPVWGNGHHEFFHGSFLNKDQTMYTWTVGLRGGYTEHDFTIAGHLLMDYSNTESFNWDEHKYDVFTPEFYGMHTLRAGLDAQLVLNNRWNLVSGAEYTKLLDHYNSIRNVGKWDLTFGANYNLDATKYFGAYVTKTVNHTRATSQGDWEFADGFGAGVKFGIDF